jgi:PAS domain S-box-containing protein
LNGHSTVEDLRAQGDDGYRRAREDELRFQRAFAEAPIGMVLATVEGNGAGTILEVNRSMCELIGYPESELVGKHFSEITYPEDLGENEELQRRLLAGEVRGYQINKRYIHANGHVVWAELNVSLVRDAAGTPLYSIAQIQDIGERRRNEAAIEESRRQLAQAQKLAHIGSWEWNVETDEVSWSEELYRIFGLEPSDEIETYDKFLERVHPDDRETVNQLIERAVGTSSPFECELRIIRSDGETRVLDSYGKIVVDDDGVRRIVGTAQDMTDSRHVEGELAIRIEAEREHKARSEFLSRISHELRTPLNAILGFAQLLEMDDLEPSQRENVQLVMKGGRHLLELINEVLEISRIDAGNLTVSLEPVRVGSVVAEALDLVEPLAREHGVSLEAWLGSNDDRHVEADNQRLKQVLLNLLSNGIKYNRPGGLVRVSVECLSEERVLIIVTDTGKGIPRDKLARVFSPFDRLGAEGTTVEGTGLGLALSKLLVDAMGGTLGVESEPYVGSTFIVSLPSAEAPRGDGGSSVPDSAPVVGHGASSTSQAVLYIEDNLSNLKLVEQTLKRLPEVRLLSAMDGGLGLELARQHRPALILLDLHLPGIEGEEVLRRLKADPATAELSVVAVSADATNARIERVLSAGADAFLTKPVDVTRLLTILDNALRERVAG